MPNPYISMTNDDPDLIKIQRQQRLADMLQQQAMQDIPINSSGGIQAPISPFSVLAKALQGYNARKYQEQADKGAVDYRTKDSAASDALIRQLTQERPKPRWVRRSLMPVCLRFPARRRHSNPLPFLLLCRRPRILA